MQIDESPNKGVLIREKAKNKFISPELKVKLKNNSPKKLLPVSPINIFAGNQLNIKNANKVGIIGNKFISE